MEMTDLAKKIYEKISSLNYEVCYGAGVFGFSPEGSTVIHTYGNESIIYKCKYDEDTDSSKDIFKSTKPSDTAKITRFIHQNELEMCDDEDFEKVASFIAETFK